MQCALCKEQIDDDSRYCDQCGGQIMVCSICGRPNKGKFCIFDGNKELIPAGSRATAIPPSGNAGVPAPQVQATSTIAQVVQPTQIPQALPANTTATQTPFAQTPFMQAPQIPPADGKVKLMSQMHGIMIEAQDGDIIGRKTGAFAGVFARFGYISGTHCKIVKTAAGWHIQDLGSTNGTFYNAGRLAPNALYPLANGATIKIADVELLVAYEADGGGTSRL